MEFSPSKNVVWRTAIPFAQSSPVLAGGRVYLTASEPDKLLTICLDAKTGRELWRRALPRQNPQGIFRANDPASPTPVADKDGVVAFFAEFGLVAYSADGKQRWSVALGPFKNFYGMAASPILAGGLVVQVCDQQSGSFLLAVDRTTGKQRWRTARPASSIGWATPMVFRPSQGQVQLIVLGTTRLDSYYLDTGESRWWMPVGTAGSLGTPVATDGTLFVSSLSSSEPMMPTFASALTMYDKDHDGRLSHDEFQGDADLGEHFGWIDDNGDGFITEAEWNKARSLGTGEFGAIALEPEKLRGQLEPSAVRWRFKKNLPYIPAPLIYRDVYFMVKDGGIVTSLDAATGRLFKEGRTREAMGEYYASPVAADGKVFLASSEGKITVLKAAPEWEVLRVNDLADEVHATPALSEGRIYVRTHSALYCFGASR
ncbi:MAG TPA: PQQ-binding-like beta-propeller repeat protein [Bryobacteraceae bacterium]|nr:PQQ-binding-like beta-propeller repeat protein [Bryobacteraceae bacterium]